MRLMSRLVLFVLISVYTTCSFGQSIDSLITGYWSGELTQADGGFIPTFIFSLNITVDGNKVSGHAIVSTRDTLTATMEFTGTIHKGGYLNIKETNLVEGSKMTTYEWCLKQYSLYFRTKEDDHYLVGFWTGVSKTSTCVPGKIKLKRRPDRV